MSHSRPAALLSTCLHSVSMVACGSQSSAPPTLLVVTPNPALTAPPLPAFHAPCHAPPETGKAVSHMVFSGPCTLTETAAVRCIHQRYDSYVFFHRKLPRGWVFDVSITVEYYNHPDTYTQLTQVYLQVTKGQTVDAWGNNLATATVTTGERSLILQPTLAPGYAGTVQVDPETIGGTLVCRPPRS